MDAEEYDERSADSVEPNLKPGPNKTKDTCYDKTQDDENNGECKSEGD